MFAGRLNVRIRRKATRIASRKKQSIQGGIIMVVQHNLTAMNSNRMLGLTTKTQAKATEKLSSGYRINRAGDDAAGLAISEKMRAQITGLQTAQKNSEDGVSLVQTAEGALTEVHSMLNRMVELATQSANGTYSSANRAEMQKEVKALQAEIDRISNTANFNGTTLFTGTTASVAIHAGETSKDANQIKITLSAMSAKSMTAKIGGTSTTIKLNSDVNVSTATLAKASIDKINTAIDIVSSMRSDFGALQNRLEHTINNLGVQTENLSAAESRIRDVDMAKEMMTYTKNNILVQASQAMLAQANQVPQGVLQLLQ